MVPTLFINFLFYAISGLRISNAHKKNPETAINMKLNQTQIEQLEKLISYKGYTEIDVQYEILDHVACEMEKLMEENPKLSLDDAFRKVHASFGIFGFSTLEESYKKMIEKRVWGYYWNALKEFILSYRIAFPLLLAIVIFQSSILLNAPKNWILMLISFVVIGNSYIMARYWKSHKDFKNYACYLGSSSIFQILNLSISICLYFYQFVYLRTAEMDSIFTNIFKGAIILVLMGFAVSIFILPKILDQSIQDTEKLKSIYEG